jgi:hypothetical protein
MARLGICLVATIALQGCEAKLDEFFAPVPNGPEGPTAGAITGTVTSSGSTLAGITVDLSGATTGNTTTDAAGAYTFDPANSGSHTLTFSGFPDYVLCGQSTLSAEVTAGQTVNADLGCEDTGGILGTITLDGAPYDGVTVSVLDESMSETTAVTGGSGQYSSEDLLVGSYDVSVVVPAAGVECTPASQMVDVMMAQMAMADFACVTVPPSATQVEGTTDVNLAWVSSTCGDPLVDFSAPATISTMDSGGTITMMVDFDDNPEPSVGEYDPETGEYSGATGWVEVAPGIEAMEMIDLTFSFDAMGNVVYIGTSHVDFRDQATQAPICTRDFILSGTVQ